ncbi:hypothetical protein EJB05_55338, partial [Eragrostis curvula]
MPPQQQRRQVHEAALQGRYSLVAVRGNGQSAEVWEARHRLTGVKVAVKIICLANSGVPMAKVEREILVMRLLRHHPHIVHLYEAVVSSENKAVYLVMELAEQGELFYYVTARQRLLQRNIRRGDFRLPPHLSDQARDLISGMLIVNPDKRMTMDKVMEHPWLLSWNNNNNNNNNALPPPLSLLPPRHHHHQKQQQAVEAAAARCGVDRNGLLDALRNG